MLRKSLWFDYLGLILLSSIWGSSFLFIKISIDTLHPALLTFSRLIVASIFLILYIKVIKREKISFFILERNIFLIAIFGNVIPFNLISWSETNLDSVIVAILIGTMPFFTFLISHFQKKGEKINKKIVIGLLLGFLGMIYLIHNSELSAKIENLSYISCGLVIIAAIGYALSANCVNQVKNMNSLQVATKSTILATIFSIPVCLLLFNSNYLSTTYSLSDISFESVLAALVLGIICTGLAVAVFFWLIKKQSAGFASQSNFFIPCFGVLWSYLFLDETINFVMLVSLSLIIFGVIFVHYGRK